MMVNNEDRISSLIAKKMLQIGDRNLSRHLDEILNEEDIVSLDAGWLLPTFAKTVNILRECGDDRTVIFVVGLPSTQFINLAEKLNISNLMVEAVRSTIYLSDDSDFIIEAFQEYRREILLEVENRVDGIRAIYRSWRSNVAERNQWEFSNDLYLWSSAEPSSSGEHN